mgnify:CR=1 FL=1
MELESDDLRMEAVQQAVERGADCILCMDERLAQLTLNMLKQLNLRVPQDIRLASLYDNENLVNTVPPISAVQFNADILGLKATQQLLCALQGQPVETRMELGYQVSCGNRRRREIRAHTEGCALFCLTHQTVYIFRKMYKMGQNKTKSPELQIQAIRDLIGFIEEP